MSGININLLAAEMQRYVVQNKNVVKADFARNLNVPLDNYAKKVTKIQGDYQVLHSLMTHVVQGFKPEWQELGEFHVKDKELKNFHQKINFGFVPADVLGTFLAEWYEEDKKPTDKEIAKRILDWIMTQVTDDVALLSMIGEYSSANASGQFGFSIDGMNTIVPKMLENSNHPCFKIPISSLTSSNVIDQISSFERQLPKILKRKINKIFVSDNIKEMYEQAYFDKYGHYPTFGMGDITKTPLRKRELVGLENLDDTIMFATVDGNLLNLIDINEPPTITDIQVQDYKVKVFGEFWKGWDFLINEAVCVANFADNTRGLGNEKLMELYYPNEDVDLTPLHPDPESITVTPSDSTKPPANGTVQFSAEVLPLEAVQDVEWSISPDVDVSIDQNSGLVTLTAETPETTYTVTATSVANPDIYGSTTLIVES